MFNFRNLALGVFGVLPCAAYAGDVSFKGFASVVAGQATNDKQAVYGYSDELSLKQDTLFALQMDSQINDRVSATIQFMSRGEDDFDVGMEWGYLTVELNPTWDVSLGRIRLPFYRYSDYLDVRYAYNWVTPPDTVYGFELPGYEGASILNTRVFGEWDSTLQIVLGKVDNALFNREYDVTFKELAGFNWVLGHDAFSLRAGALTGNATVTNESLAALVGALRGGYAANFGDPAVRDQLNTATDSIVDDVEMLNDRTSFYSLGLSYDPGQYFVEAEYVHYEVEDGLLPATDAWYVSAGRRFGNFTVYATYSVENDDANQELVEALNAPSPNLEYAFAPIRQTLDGALTGLSNDTVVWDIGLRWDFAASTAFKVAYEEAENDLNDEDTGLLRAGIDVVF